MKRSILFKAAIAAISLTLSLIGYSEELQVVAIEPTKTNYEALYPTENIKRPSVMPVGIVAINLDANVEKLQLLNFGLRTEFGLVNKLEGRFSWDGFENNSKSQDKLDIKRTVNLGS